MHNTLTRIVRDVPEESWNDWLEGLKATGDGIAWIKYLGGQVEHLGEWSFLGTTPDPWGDPPRPETTSERRQFSRAAWFQLVLLVSVFFLASAIVGVPLAIAFAVFLFILEYPMMLAAETAGGLLLQLMAGEKLVKHGGYIVGHAAVLLFGLWIVTVPHAGFLSPLVFGFLALVSIPEFLYINAGEVLRNIWVLAINLLMMLAIFLAFAG